MPCAPSTEWNQEMLACTHVSHGTDTPDSTTSTEPLRPGHDCTDANTPCTQENIEAQKLYHPHFEPSKYIQCSVWGQCFERPCSIGTEWDQNLLACNVKDSHRSETTEAPQKITTTAEPPKTTLVPSIAPSNVPTTEPAQTTTTVETEIKTHEPSTAPSGMPATDVTHSTSAMPSFVIQEAGNNQSFKHNAPSNTLNCVIALEGQFPSRSRRSLRRHNNRSHRGLAGNNPFLGEISWVPFTFAPRGWALCDGQILEISQHTALFSLIGTFYGGDGRTTFALPDMRGRKMLHVGNGAGLTARGIGDKGGSEDIQLTIANLPSHSHVVQNGGALELTGGNEPFPIMPPYVTLRCIIALQGIFPSRSRRELEIDQNHNTHRRLGSDPFLGEIAWVPYDFAPRGWANCDGQLLPIAQNTALFSLLGTTYGGDGRTTFGLPDARGRTLVHAGIGPGLTHRNLGSKGGTEAVQLNIQNLPSHSHSNFTQHTGSNQPFPLPSPFVTMHCVIALQGVYPSRSRRMESDSKNGTTAGKESVQRSLHGDEPYIGDVMWIPYNFAPRGWAFCNGQLLPINQNQALFSLLGTNYGGDGRTTFALPDFRGRSMAHAGNAVGTAPHRLGEKFGFETHTLTLNEMAAHAHLQ